jgi:hypothetical protein
VTNEGSLRIPKRFEHGVREIFARWRHARPERRAGHAGVKLRPAPERGRSMLFLGYADQVASLYAGLDLRKNF